VAKLVEEVTSTVEPKASKPAAMDSYVNAPVNVTTKKQAPVLKNRVFAGSVEWTDKKIAEYQSHLTENRTPGIDNANSASQQKSDNPRFKQPQMVNYETSLVYSNLSTCLSLTKTNCRPLKRKSSKGQSAKSVNTARSTTK
jgi:hypothetical protein